MPRKEESDLDELEDEQVKQIMKVVESEKELPSLAFGFSPSGAIKFEDQKPEIEGQATAPSQKLDEDSSEEEA